MRAHVVSSVEPFTDTLTRVSLYTSAKNFVPVLAQQPTLSNR
jgi:hypothetical protein